MLVRYLLPLFALLVHLPACASVEESTVTDHGVYTYTILGSAQDAGLPHIGCQRENCQLARAEGRRERVAALGISGETGWWLLDATPDLPAQIQAMGEMPQAIFLTHAHIGHYTGLMYLGREALGAKGLAVWCSPSMAEFLRTNGPWNQLVELGQIELHTFQNDVAVQLEAGLSLTPIQVPHRDEYSDTHAFLLENRRGGSLLFVPDIDAWSKWSRRLSEFATAGTHLLLDATFYSAAELPNRDLSEIPHPLVTQTMDLLDDMQSEAVVRFIHLNHSNPLWQSNGPEARALRARGFHLAKQGDQWAF